MRRPRRQPPRSPHLTMRPRAGSVPLRLSSPEALRKASAQQPPKRWGDCGLPSKRISGLLPSLAGRPPNLGSVLPALVRRHPSHHPPFRLRTYDICAGTMNAGLVLLTVSPGSLAFAWSSRRSAIGRPRRRRRKAWSIPLSPCCFAPGRSSLPLDSRDFYTQRR